jgi:hypothetical protein
MKPYRGAPMTLGNAAAAIVRLIVWYRGCGRQVEPNPGEMATRYGGVRSPRTGKADCGQDTLGARDARSPPFAFRQPRPPPREINRKPVVTFAEGRSVLVFALDHYCGGRRDSLHHPQSRRRRSMRALIMMLRR